jgi:hypothetical protein
MKTIREPSCDFGQRLLTDLPRRADQLSTKAAGISRFITQSVATYATKKHKLRNLGTKSLAGSQRPQ